MVRPSTYGKRTAKSVTRSKKYRNKFAHDMRKFYEGELHDSHGNVVTDPEQAKAIADSQGNKAARKGKKTMKKKGKGKKK
jgi:hypothetical protein